jgi:hypothetical protein
MLQMYELLEVTVPGGKTVPVPVSEQTSEAESTAEIESSDPWNYWRVTGTQSIGSHTRGMQSLVRIRNPASFKTEMDRSLLCSLVENFWLQAYLNNVDDFLEELD